MQIQMLDHVIVGAPAIGRAGYFSFKEVGVINWMAKAVRNDGCYFKLSLLPVAYLVKPEIAVPIRVGQA